MDNPQDRFELDSQLTELSRVQPWIEALADLYGFSEDASFPLGGDPRFRDRRQSVALCPHRACSA